jgi:hypothetical protein
MENLGSSGAEAVQFEAVEQDGRWYVSPTGTMWRWIMAFTGTLDEAVIQDIGDQVRDASEDPALIERRMEDWLEEVQASGLLDGLGPLPGEPLYGPELLGSYAEQSNVLLVWDADASFVSDSIGAIYGSDLVVRVIAPADLHEMFEASFGPGSTNGLTPGEFPVGIQLAAVDVDTLVEIFNWPEIIDLYLAADLDLNEF